MYQQRYNPYAELRKQAEIQFEDSRIFFSSGRIKWLISTLIILGGIIMGIIALISYINRCDENDEKNQQQSKCLDIRTRYMIGIGVAIIATIAYGLIDFYRVKRIISIDYGD